MKLIFDCETNGLIPELDRLHCLAWHDLVDASSRDFDPTNVEEGVRGLMEADTLIGHNIVGFDLKAIRKVYPWFKLSRHVKVLDTLLLAKRVWPLDVLLAKDMVLFRKGALPSKYIKRYSLGAFGYRFGELKDEYDGGWEEWSPTMQSYLRQDVRANTPLWKRLEYLLGWSDEAKAKKVYSWPMLPIEIEHGAASIIADQELAGVGFDKEKAQALATNLANRQAELTTALQDIFGAWWEPLDNIHTGRKPKRDHAKKLTDFPNVTIPRVSEKTGKPLKPYVGPPLEQYWTDAPYVRIKRTTFNPSSRKHLGDRLQKVFGWNPVAYTDGGQAQVDEGVIKSIPASVIDEKTRATILEYFVTTKILAMVNGTSKSAWLNCVSERDGRVHGRCDTIGTITTRAAHFNPNLGQTPAVSIDKDTNEPVLGVDGGFGWECRDLWVARPGWEMSGTDMSSLEFIMLGHDLYPLDGGVFSDRVSDPNRDPHQEHSDLTGLGRAATKNVGYAYIFGGGDYKIGIMIGVTEDEIPALLKTKGLQGKINFRKRIMGPDYKEPSDRDKAIIAKGSIVKKKFEDAIVGLKYLKDDMTETAKARGWIKSIDGSKLVVRKAHAALNARLQGGGAAACKLWDIIVHMMLEGPLDVPLPIIEGHLTDITPEGLTRGVDFQQVLWVHDELQFEHKPGLGPIIKRVSNDAAQRAGVILGLRGRFRTDTKTGSSWAHTH